MKLRSDSFAARLSEAQRDELFTLLAGGLSLAEAAAKVREWTRAEWPHAKAPSAQAVSAWFAGSRVERRFAVAKQNAVIAQANAPADVSAEARKALGLARFLATLEELTPGEVAILDRNEIARDNLAFNRERLAQDKRVERRNLALDRARLLLERARGGERGEDLQKQIDLALDEIEKLKHGEDA